MERLREFFSFYLPPVSKLNSTTKLHFFELFFQTVYISMDYFILPIIKL
ncbi:MAG: hypothetical protein CM15mP85_30230 [Rhodobacterales bacterium]|nr:MAG: hypothetical protein CM15mP85_30230 [Rhodobacterales bacterium]